MGRKAVRAVYPSRPNLVSTRAEGGRFRDRLRARAAMQARAPVYL